MALTKVSASKEVKAEIDTLANEYGFTQSQVLDYLLGLHKEKLNSVKEAQKEGGKAWENRNRGNTTTQKLDLFFDMLFKHNTEQRKETSPIFLHEKSLTFLSTELGMNKMRDIKPYLDVNREVIDTHYEGGRGQAIVTKEAMRADAWRSKDENGKSAYLTELMQKYGIAEMFGR